MATANPTVTEAQILTTFLLSRASLQDVVPLKQFTELFPQVHRANPQIKLLYRELQVARNRQIERVKKNIQMEARLGAKHRQEAARTRREEERADPDAMVGVELFGGSAVQPKLPLKDLLQAMSSAADELDQEYQTLDKECDAMLDTIRTIVGDLSDLRYGKLASSGTDEQVINQLENLTEVCNRALKAPDQEQE